MAIVWSTEKCTPPAPLDADDAANRDALIFGSVDLRVGPVLTNHAAAEWLVRWRIWERWTGAKRDSLFRNATAAEVVCRWRGLKVNTDRLSRAEWLESMVAGLVEEAEHEARQGNLDELVAKLCHGEESRMEGGTHGCDR